MSTNARMADSAVIVDIGALTQHALPQYALGQYLLACEERLGAPASGKHTEWVRVTIGSHSFRGYVKYVDVDDRYPVIVYLRVVAMDTHSSLHGYIRVTRRLGRDVDNGACRLDAFKADQRWLRTSRTLDGTSVRAAFAA